MITVPDRQKSTSWDDIGRKCPDAGKGLEGPMPFGAADICLAGLGDNRLVAKMNYSSGIDK